MFSQTNFVFKNAVFRYIYGGYRWQLCMAKFVTVRTRHKYILGLLIKKNTERTSHLKLSSTLSFDLIAKRQNCSASYQIH